MRVVPKAHMDASQNWLSALLTTHAESIYDGSSCTNQMVRAGSQMQERHRASGLEFQINPTQTKGSGMI